MQNSTFTPIASIIIIGLAFYFIYGYLSPKAVDLEQYQLLCESYLKDKVNQYSSDEKQMLVNEIHFLIPDELSEIKSEQKRKIKHCAEALSLKSQ